MQNFKRFWDSKFNLSILGMFIVAIILIIWGLIGNQAPDLLLNLGTEIIGIVITVLIIDRLYKERELAEQKKYLLRQLRSDNPTDTMEALRELNASGWGNNLDGIVLHGGNLSGANLVGKSLRKILATGVVFEGTLFNGSDLSEAVLRIANLKKANFASTLLNHAELDGANLEGAYFNDVEETLSKALMLYGAIMPDGKKYNGKFNLNGDRYWHISQGGEDTPESWSNFYQVSVEEYLSGQE